MLIKKVLFLLILIYTSLTSSEIRILTNEEPPTNFMKDNKVTGITVDVVNEIRKKLKINSQIELITWEKAYTLVQKEKNIILFTAGRTKNRMMKGFTFLGPIITKHAVLYKKSEKKLDISNMLNIKSHNLKIGAMNQDWRSQYFKDKGFKVYEESNHNQNIKKLINGNIDLWAISKIEAQIIAKKADINPNKIDVAYKFRDISSYIIFSKGTSKKTIRQWQKAYKDLQKTDFFHKTAKKWSVLLKVNLIYDRDKGFYIK